MLRLMHLQSLRGLACLLLVLFHVVGDSPQAGLRLDEAHPLQFFNQVLAYLRMPLFAAIAGFVYALRPVRQQPLAFLAGKARRLLWPLLTVGTTFALLQSLTPGTNTQDAAAWDIVLLPHAHFWFLQALFLVFIATVVMERLGLLASAGRSLAAAAGVATVFMVASPPPWFSADSALYLLQYFLLGVAARQLGSPPRRALAAATGLFLALALALLASDTPIQPRQSPVALALGGLGTWLLLMLPWTSAPLARLGDHSYAVFLFHVFFTAASRLGLERWGIDALPLLVGAGLVAGVLGPIALSRVITRSGWAATLLLGDGRRAPTRRPAGTGVSPQFMTRRAVMPIASRPANPPEDRR